jgi:hypothetical protein
LLELQLITAASRLARRCQRRDHLRLDGGVVDRRRAGDPKFGGVPQNLVALSVVLVCFFVTFPFNRP